MAGNTQAGGIKILWTTATIDFGNTNAQTNTDSSGITITGASVGDPCIVGFGDGTVPNGTYSAYVSAADTVKVRYMNQTSGAIDPASQNFIVGVVKLVSYS